MVNIASVESLEGLTIGRLASVLGISKSGLFAHFGSKEDLQCAVVDEAPRSSRASRSGSGGGHKPLHCFRPLSAGGVIAGEFAGPGTRQLLRGSSEEGELLRRACALDLLVEFSRLFRGIPPNVDLRALGVPYDLDLNHL